jgi:acetoacetate decarboxylase
MIQPPYPPPPWQLHGTLHAALWRIPRADLPGPLPAGARPLGWGGTALLLTVRADWDTTGDLAYGELVVAVPVRLGRRLATTVTAAWVDSPASLAGGQALWAIPKRLGQFETMKGETTLIDDDGPIARFHDRPGRALPFRLPVRLTTLQPRGDALVATRSEAAGRLGFGGLGWDFAATGPLAILAGRRPLLTVTLTDAAARFGL